MKKYSFLGKDQGNIIRLFSVKEIRNKIDNWYFDLQLSFPNRGLFKYGSNITDLIKNFNEEDFVKSSDNQGPHISIHYNPTKSTIFVNRTTNVKRGCNVDGIKNRNLFAPVILRILGKTSHSHYNAKTRHINKGLDSGICFNSQDDSLVMFFLVSKKGVVFHKDPEYPALYIEEDFNDFRLTVIFRYFNERPEKMSINFFPTTKPGKSITGIEWWQAYNLLNDLEQLFVDAYFKNTTIS